MVSLQGHTLGQYTLQEPIGQGGMAVVYLARQASMNRNVAVKVLATDLAGDPDFSARFRREAETIAQLEHPHILPVIDFGEQDEYVYLVMRLISGGTLAQELREGPLALSRANRLLHQIASALSYAHSKGVIHRDLKPANVLLDDDDNTYLTDFGIAKMLAGTTNMTRSGHLMGTPIYMAPEQWRSLPVDARTDVYALGMMLYEMLVGLQPFHADTPYALMYEHMDKLPASPVRYHPGLPAALEPVLFKAIAKLPRDRYPSAQAFAADFNRVVRRAPNPDYQPIRPKQRFESMRSGLPDDLEFSTHELDAVRPEDLPSWAKRIEGAPGRPDDAPGPPDDAPETGPQPVVTPPGTVQDDLVTMTPPDARRPEPPEDRTPPARTPPLRTPRYSDEMTEMVPLDVGPPGRGGRRGCLVRGILGIGSVLLLVAVTVIAWFALRDEDGTTQQAAGATLSPTATQLVIVLVPTDTPTPTSTDTPTETPTRAPTETPAGAASPTSTATDAPTGTPTGSMIVILPTDTATDRPGGAEGGASVTPEPTDTAPPTRTPTETPTSAPTDTPTHTPTEGAIIILPTQAPPTETPDYDATASFLVDQRFTQTAAAASPTPSQTPSPTETMTPTPTDTPSATHTVPPSTTPSPTDTPLPTATSTHTPTATAALPTLPPPPTATRTVQPPAVSDTPTRTPSRTPSPTGDSSASSGTALPTMAPLATVTIAPLVTATFPPTPTVPPSDTPPPTNTVPPPSDTPLPSDTPPPTNTVAPTNTLAPTNTPLPTNTLAPTDTLAPTNTPVPTDTPVPVTPTPDISPTPPAIAAALAPCYASAPSTNTVIVRYGPSPGFNSSDRLRPGTVRRALLRTSTGYMYLDTGWVDEDVVRLEPASTCRSLPVISPQDTAAGAVCRVRAASEITDLRIQPDPAASRFQIVDEGTELDVLRVVTGADDQLWYYVATGDANWYFGWTPASQTDAITGCPAPEPYDTTQPPESSAALCYALPAGDVPVALFAGPSADFRASGELTRADRLIARMQTATGFVFVGDGWAGRDSLVLLPDQACEALPELVPQRPHESAAVLCTLVAVQVPSTLRIRPDVAADVLVEIEAGTTLPVFHVVSGANGRPWYYAGLPNGNGHFGWIAQFQADEQTACPLPEETP